MFTAILRADSPWIEASIDEKAMHITTSSGAGRTHPQGEV